MKLNYISKTLSFVMMMIISSLNLIYAQESTPWNTNLLINSNVEDGFNNWTTNSLDPNRGWGIKNGEDEIACWASSHQTCVMSQTILLEDVGFTKEQIELQPYLTFGGNYMCPWAGDNIGKASTTIYFYDINGHVLSSTTLFDIEYQSSDVPWTNITKKIQLPSSVHSIKYEMKGVDSKGWSGQYGPRFNNTWMSISQTENESFSQKSIICNNENITNGTISVDKTSAGPGETVHVIASPNAGYGLKQIIATDEQGTLINASADNTFIMPARYDIIITASFAKSEGLNIVCEEIENGTINVDKPIANAGDVVQINVIHDENYSIKKLRVKDSENHLIPINENLTFIMPLSNVTIDGELWIYHNLEESDFFEGFEDYAQGPLNVQNWMDLNIIGTKQWQVYMNNIDYNRYPRTGNNSLCLYYGNTNTLSTPILLKEGQSYEFEMYARQDHENRNHANIEVKLNKGLPEFITQSIGLIEATGVTNGDYQQFKKIFTVNETGLYNLTIKGYINSTPFYLTMDDISLKKSTGEGTGVKQDMNIDHLSIYPNPAKDAITLKGLNGEQTSISIYNLSGQLMINENSEGKEKVKIDISSLTEGVYLLKAQNQVIKLMVK